MGSEGAYTVCHYDTYGCNLVAQIHGRLVLPVPVCNKNPDRVTVYHCNITCTITSRLRCPYTLEVSLTKHSDWCNTYYHPRQFSSNLNNDSKRPCVPYLLYSGTSPYSHLTSMATLAQSQIVFHSAKKV